MAAEYPELIEAIQKFPDLRFLNNGRCAKCNGAAGEGNRHISQHHIFPHRYWRDNAYKISLCTANGKPIKDSGRIVCASGCHSLIERWIKQIEEGRQREPIIYCLLTMAFLRGETFFDLSMPKPQ